MKIGILTFHRALNYGAVLQCYSLKESLCDLGHDVEVIDYRPSALERLRLAFSWNSFKKRDLKNKIKYLCLIPSSYYHKRKTSVIFDDFLEKNFHFSKIVKSPDAIPNCYDVIIFGSDQIWSSKLCDGFDPIYYGEFPKGNMHFISYAASLEGYQSFSSQDWSYVESRLCCFDGLSVREKSFGKELAIHTKCRAKWVVDPTLLVSSSILEKIMVRPSFKNYIFLFTVQPGDEPYRVAKYIAKQKNCIVVRARATQRLNILNRERGVKNINGCSPNLFLGLISYADSVVTNSFHATAISLQFEKEFYAVNCKYSNRISDLLESIDLSDRYISSVDMVDQVKPIDYSRIHSCLKKLSECSFAYLLDNIKC